VGGEQELRGGGYWNTAGNVGRCQVCPGCETVLGGHPCLVVYLQAEITYRLCTTTQRSEPYEVMSFGDMDAVTELSLNAPAQA